MFTASARFAVLLTACTLGGCSDLREEPRGDLFIRGALSLSRADDCRIKPDPKTPPLLGGVMDLAFVREYAAFLLVGNKMPDDARGVSLHSAGVTLEDDTGNVVKQFTTDATGFVDPPSGGAPGFGAALAILIPEDAIAPPARVTARVRVVGKIAGGADVESSELTFPIAVCVGCLVLFPADAVDLPTGDCIGTSPEAAPCVMGQDEAVDCRLCAGNPACRLGF